MMQTDLPGARLLQFAERWFEPAVVRRAFEPLVADWQRQWIDAPPRLRWRSTVYGALAFAIAAVTSAPRAVLLAPMPASMVRRVLSRLVIFTGVVSALLTVPILWEMRSMPPRQMVWLAIWLLPASVTLALPFSMTWVVDAIRRRRTATPIERVAAMRVAIIAVICTTTLCGWLVPAANQIFREGAAPEWARPPAHGVHELALFELIVAPDRATALEPYTRNGMRGAIRRELNNRAVLAILPAVLLWVRWEALLRARLRWFSPLPASAATVLTITGFFGLYFSSVVIEPTLGWQPGTALWLPIAALMLWGAVERTASRRRATQGMKEVGA